MILVETVIIFGAGNSSSAHADYRKKYILVFGEGTTQGLVDTKITAEAKYSINSYCIKIEIFISQRLDYNESNSYLYVNRVNIYQF